MNSALGEIKSQLTNTILPEVLVYTIVKYMETHVKVQFEDHKINHYTESQFENLDCKNAVEIYIYGVLVLIDPKKKFKNSKIQNIIGNVVLIGDASEMFYNAKKFIGYAPWDTTALDIDFWDTSQVTNMSGMFFGASNFDSDIGAWNTSNVIDMSFMFCDATIFNADIDNWDTSRVKDMNHMFRRSEDFNANISEWKTGSVTDMSFMFYGAIRFNKPLNWDTSKVKNMSYMFCKTVMFNKPLNWNTSQVTDMSYMFSDAIRFDQDLSNWNTKNVRNATGMFEEF
jgi:surface protein